ncbi:MaoC family dehydratase [Rhodococcus sp. 14C212]|uniref:MaoC family dehydratase n=1 Tax=Rhodococcus sp. 14C212 TaxID=2711209 RepID=UPI0013EDC421|nr:MaoC family dehydratase [Rhodococcus sp. 14C212]NGP04786.1 MaoC family dehydratase [Rhodococcus sp. 14C212]
MNAGTVTVGQSLPPLTIRADPTFVVSTALATRDFQDVHHDRDKAQQRGSKDIFVNILTDTGLVQRYVTDWAGPRAVLKSVSLRLGVPWYAYDSLTLTGTVAAVEDDGRITVDIAGKNGLGDHITAKAVLVIGGTA